MTIIVCRGCLKEDDLLSIFDVQKVEKHKTIKCSEMFSLCTSLSVDEMDGHPGFICNQCLKKLKSAYIFRLQCEKSYQYIAYYRSNEVVKEQINIDAIEDSKDACEQRNIDKLFVEIKCEKEEESENYALQEEKKGDIDDSLDFCDDNIENDFSFEPKDETNDEIKVEFFKPESYAGVKRKKSKVKKEKKSHKKKRSRGKQVLKCQYCDKIYRDRYSLLEHEDTHIGLKRYYCELCKKEYRSEKAHKNVHKRGFNFKCDICNKCFGTKTKLSLHVVTHNTKRETFVCDMEGCNKKFLTKGGLKKHVDLHDGVQNFVCHLCSNKYKDKYSLQIHIRKHYNDKKYPCAYCDKSFYCNSAKTQHEYRHTNKRNHGCPDCEYRCYNTTALKRHMLTHTKEYKEECRFCPKRFLERYARRAHERMVHKLADGEVKKDTQVVNKI